MEPKLTSLATGGGCGCKLAPHVLKEILAKMPVAVPSSDLLIDASTSDDAAVYKVSDEHAIVATTDFFAPIVDDPFAFGQIAATNALSDVYAMGATPIFTLAIVGMPINTLPAETISQIVAGGADIANKAGAPVAGGHSIDTAEPIYGLIALGITSPDAVKTNAGAKVGDKLILSKPLGIGVFSAALKRGILSEAGYRTMIESTTLLNTPGKKLGGLKGVHAMTDVTGFGLLGHSLEMAKASGHGITLDRSALPVFKEAQELLEKGIKTGASARNWTAVKDSVMTPGDWSGLDEALLTDPQTSGGLLISAHPDKVDEVLSVLADEGFHKAAIVGEITDTKNVTLK